MASKRTIQIQPSGDMQITQKEFRNDRDAYADMQGQGMLASMARGVEARTTAKETVTVAYDTGQVVVITYHYDAKNYWEA